MRLPRALALLPLMLLPACARGGSIGSLDADVRADAGAPVVDSSSPVDAFTPTDAPVGCVPSCAGLACGDDGCGGSCGSCGSGTCVAGSCTTCTPSCAGRVCGDDGCGGSCGTCSSGACVSGSCSCTPSCVGRTCGDDGCGGSCGTCGSLCMDTCSFAFDSDCDDGGPLSDYSLCDLGTDCADCGPRTAVCSEGTCVSL